MKTYVRFFTKTDFMEHNRGADSSNLLVHFMFSFVSGREREILQSREKVLVRGCEKCLPTLA